MRNLYLLALISLSWASCDFEIARESKQEVKEEKTTKKKDTTKVLKFDFWTSKNIKKRLTKYGKKHPGDEAIIKTNKGNIHVKLHDDTPLHRANFVRLANIDFFDSTIFFRVKKNFILQGGISDRNNNLNRQTKLVEAGNYKVPSEIREKYPHVKGALAMANKSSFTDKKNEKDYSSDPFNFYIVHGKNITPSILKSTENKYGLDISKANKKRYLREGGTPHLDQQYTVFGYVVSGMSIVNKIANVATDDNNMPINRIVINSVDIKSD